MTLDVIGGNADATQVEGSFVVSLEILGDKYIAIEFQPDPKVKNKTVTIYMLAGTTPVDAIRIWRERNMKQTEEQWERLCDTARKLIDAPASVIAEDPENFVAMIDISLAAIETAKMRIGRGGLILELGDKRKDIRNHPERYISKAIQSVVDHPQNHSRETSPTPDLGKGRGRGTETGKLHPQDSDVGSALCPECSGLEVHNDNCSQKNLPVPVLAEPEKRQPEKSLSDGEARESTENCDRMDEGSSMADSRGGQNPSDKDDQPW